MAIVAMVCLLAATLLQTLTPGLLLRSLAPAALSAVAVSLVLAALSAVLVERDLAAAAAVTVPAPHPVGV
jgi:hypothetical protein